MLTCCLWSWYILAVGELGTEQRVNGCKQGWSLETRPIGVVLEIYTPNRGGGWRHAQ